MCSVAVPIGTVFEVVLVLEVLSTRCSSSKLIMAHMNTRVDDIDDNPTTVTVVAVHLIQRQGSLVDAVETPYRVHLVGRNVYLGILESNQARNQLLVTSLK